ncbi:MAG TPA: hypothetical protein PK970_00355 [Hyphomicrobiaceae bacterium]|nr:hypothetical protein [Hyphomicrobiaceae bacterium]
MKRYQWIVAGFMLMVLLVLVILQRRIDAEVGACEVVGGVFVGGRCEPMRPPPILERDLRRS